MLEKDKLLHNKKGFGLLELLIYLAILAIISLIVVNIFLSLNRARGQSVSQNEVNSNLRFASERIAQDIRSATAVTTPSATSTPTSTLDMTISGATVSYCIAGEQLRRQIGGTCDASSEKITGDAVTVSTSTTFTRYENTNTVLGKTIISIEFFLYMSYNSNSPDWQYSGSKRTTVSLY